MFYRRCSLQHTKDALATWQRHKKFFCELTTTEVYKLMVKSVRFKGSVLGSTWAVPNHKSVTKMNISLQFDCKTQLSLQ